MTVLLIDAGNARVKWALCDHNGIGLLQDADYAQDPDGAVAALNTAATESVDAIVVSNVAGAGFRQVLDRLSINTEQTPSGAHAASARRAAYATHTRTPKGLVSTAGPHWLAPTRDCSLAQTSVPCASLMPARQ